MASIDLTRRQFLRVLEALGVVAVAPWTNVAIAGDSSSGRGLSFGPPQPFSFERLRRHARELARRPFHPIPVPHPALLDKLSFDVYQQIRFRSRDALWRDGRHPFPVEFFHLGKYARRPVRIHVVSRAVARRVIYSRRLFAYGKSGLRGEMPPDLGFSGFRVMHVGRDKGDWLAFKGASYFRSAGPLNQYGLSARGIAVDTAVPGRKEEFPSFTSFWLEEPPGLADAIVVYALLDGPSLTGAYRIVCRDGRKQIISDVHAELFQRKDIVRLGVAPLTSMYWYSETNRRTGGDWHPEIHDSDGLAMWTGKGERIWRPLNNPLRVRTDSFLDHNPKGFGLLQRDRDFDHYLDDSAYYNRRPSAWVEPKGDWQSGSVMLVEMPTDSEINDNVVAFWKPDRAATVGTSWSLDYRLYWVARQPFPLSVAHVVATRLGRPGIPGQHKRRDPHGRKFVIEFAGGPLATMRQRFDIEAVVTASRGTVHNRHVLKILGTNRWRGQFDLHVLGTEPVGLRCYLRLDHRTLSETWLFQFIPGDYGFRCE